LRLRGSRLITGETGYSLGKPVNSPQLKADPHLSASTARLNLPLKHALKPAETEDQHPEFPVNSPDKPVNSPGKPVNHPESPVNPPEAGDQHPESPVYSPGKPVNSAEKPVNSPQSPVNSPESALSTTTTTTKSNHKEKVVVEKGDTGFYDENRRFFWDIGITSNLHTDLIASQLAPDLIRLEWQKLLDKDKPWPGLLIKILSNLPPPAHPRDCDCPECQGRRLERDRRLRQRYAEWET
jgi:hypothetical protein